MQGDGQQRGFTLVEVGITVAILALAAAVVIPGINNVSRADLRKAASGINVTVRSAFDDAALSGNTYRLVLEPGKPVIKVEGTEESLTFDARDGAFIAASQAEAELTALDDFPGSSADKSGGKSQDKGKDKKGAKPPVTHKSDSETDTDSGPGGGALAALFNINKLGSKSAQAGFTPRGKYDIGDNVRIMDVWTDGMDQAISEGEAYLYFFPNGYTQDALIHLEDRDKRVYTIKVAPLTGKCVITDKYIEVPK